MKGSEEMIHIGDTIHDCEIDWLELDDNEIWKVNYATSEYDGEFAQPHSLFFA